MSGFRKSGHIYQKNWVAFVQSIGNFHYQGRMEGGFLGFQETPFDSKTISKINYLNKYTIIDILASYA